MVTKQELSEKAKSLKESNEKFQTLLEVIPQMTWTNLPSGEVNFYNQQWYNYTGLNYDQTKEWGWKNIVHPDDLAATLNNYTHALQSGNVFVNENRYKRADGEYRWQLNKAMPVKNNLGRLFYG